LPLLQVRPFITRAGLEMVSVGSRERGYAWCYTFRALGNGIKYNLFDIVYVPPRLFDKARTREIAEQVGGVNRKLVDQKRPYILIGFGRWGSFDPWLGIGVRGPRFPAPQCLSRQDLQTSTIDPSQGTHFFQNMTSVGMGYLSIPYAADQASIDWDWLESLPAESELETSSHVRLQVPPRLESTEEPGKRHHSSRR